jgi:ABC-2 type transport system ATP-binding protein
MTDDAIKIKGLVKYYDGRCILDGIDLAVPPGCIYGLLGRNGIGKTTLIRILLGLENPTRGSTHIQGIESHQLTAQQKGKIGCVAEGHHLIQNYKVSRLVELCQSLALRWNREFFDHIIETFRLPMDRRVSQLSTGMRAQLNLALAMAIDPEVLILDDLAIEIFQKDNRTILFSSHILSDVERIAERIGIIAGGKLIIDCALEELKKRVTKLRLIFPHDAPADLHITEIINQHNQGREMILTIANLNDQKRAVIETFKPASCTEIPMSLEDIFIECTRPARTLITA